jgi:lysophospholipase L1-like esterase
LSRLTLSLAAALSCAAGLPAAEPFELKDGDRVILIGGTLIEREQKYGYWETALTVRFPDRNVTFRNLGWSGDTVWGESRAAFDTPVQGYKRLIDLALAEKPTVIVVGYGTGESFAGAAGLDKFKQQYNKLLDDLAPAKARFVLFGPPELEDLPQPLPDTTAQNANVHTYAAAIRQIAEKRGYKFVPLADLFGEAKAVLPDEPLTDDGMHLTGFGYYRLAKYVLREIADLPADDAIELKGTEKRTVKHTRLPLPAAPDNPPVPFSPSCRLVKAMGLPDGNFALRIDGTAVAEQLAKKWAQGVCVTKGPEIDQSEKLRRTIVEKNREYFYRWRPQNETYLFGFRKHEQGKNAAEVVQFDPIVAGLEKEIAKLRVPVEHTYELVPAK